MRREPPQRRLGDLEESSCVASARPDVLRSTLRRFQGAAHPSFSRSPPRCALPHLPRFTWPTSIAEYASDPVGAVPQASLIWRLFRRVGHGHGNRVIQVPFRRSAGAFWPTASLIGVYAVEMAPGRGFEPLKRTRPSSHVGHRAKGPSRPLRPASLIPHSPAPAAEEGLRT